MVEGLCVVVDVVLVVDERMVSLAVQEQQQADDEELYELYKSERMLRIVRMRGDEVMGVEPCGRMRGWCNPAEAKAADVDSGHSEDAAGVDGMREWWVSW